MCIPAVLPLIALNSIATSPAPDAAAAAQARRQPRAQSLRLEAEPTHMRVSTSVTHEGGDLTPRRVVIGTSSTARLPSDTPWRHAPCPHTNGNADDRRGISLD